jgi:hypothetical protein
LKAPLEMPTMYVAQQQFELQRVDYAAPEGSGRVGVVQAGFPLWSATYTLGRMPPAYSDQWEAFIRGLRGATRRFLGRDLSRQYPLLYPDGFGAFGVFTGGAASWSQTIDSNGDAQLTLNLGAAAAGLTLSPGDGIDFRYPATEDAVAGLAWRAFVMVNVGATANGSGSLTITVEPPVPSAFRTSAREDDRVGRQWRRSRPAKRSSRELFRSRRALVERRSVCGAAMASFRSTARLSAARRSRPCSADRRRESAVSRRA